MRVPRVLLREPVAGRETVVLDAQAAHYVQKVLRLRAGDRVVLFDGHGGEYHGVLATTGAGAAVRIDAFRPDDRNLAGLEVTLWQAVCRGNRMDNALEKATELGVSRIVPLLSERVVVKLRGERGDSRRDHWQRVVDAACEQCGLNRVPEVAAPVALRDALVAERARQRPAPFTTLHWLLHHNATQHLATVAAGRVQPPLDLTLAVGPEGGFDDGEIALLQSEGFAAVAMGPRVLRADTAAPAALAMLQALVHLDAAGPMTVPPAADPTIKEDPA